ncbi:MAG: VOC family protein [Acidimicrobiales bacterium]
MAKVKPVPDGYPTVSPGLSIDGAAAAIEFYVKVLGATERMRFDAPDGRIGHAELQIGDSVIMLSDEYPEMGFRSPKAIGGTPVTMNVYVDNVDAVFARALAEGATSLRPVENQFYGDRSGAFEDPFGHRWNVAMHVEDVPPDEMEKRAAAAMGAG